MNRFVEAAPRILFDSHGKPIDVPEQLPEGSRFFLSQYQPLASGELVQNPFDVQPGLLDIPQVQYPTEFPDPDLLLVEVDEVHDESTGTCKVVAEVNDTAEILQRADAGREPLTDDNFEIKSSQNPFSDDILRESTNELLNNTL
jgi:hypothetical protein